MSTSNEQECQHCRIYPPATEYWICQQSPKITRMSTSNENSTKSDNRTNAYYYTNRRLNRNLNKNSIQDTFPQISSMCLLFIHFIINLGENKTDFHETNMLIPAIFTPQTIINGLLKIF